MERSEQDGVPLDGGCQAVQTGHDKTIQHINIHQMKIRRTRICAVSYHSHHHIVVLLKSQWQQERHHREEHDVTRQNNIFSPINHEPLFPFSIFGKQPAYSVQPSCPIHMPRVGRTELFYPFSTPHPFLHRSPFPHPSALLHL